MAEAILTGAVRGWPKGRPATLDSSVSDTLKQLTVELGPAARAHLVRLVGLWGNEALGRLGTEMAVSLLASTRDPQQPESRRIEAGRQLIELRPADPGAAQGLLELITTPISTDLTSGLVDAVAASKAPAVGTALVAVLPKLSPGVRSRVLRTLLGRSDWIPAFVDQLERDPGPSV